MGFLYKCLALQKLMFNISLLLLKIQQTEKNPSEECALQKIFGPNKERLRSNYFGISSYGALGPMQKFFKYVLNFFLTFRDLKQNLISFLYKT